MLELQQKLIRVLYECDLHKKRLEYAYGMSKHMLPFSEEVYPDLSDEDVAHIDQFLFRFSKMQDVMGEKLFIIVLSLLEENIKQKPFIDILNRLERLELLETDSWISLRKIRNSVAHEYGFNVLEIVESLNAIYEAKNELVQIYDRFVIFCKSKFKFLE